MCGESEQGAKSPKILSIIIVISSWQLGVALLLAVAANLGGTRSPSAIQILCDCTQVIQDKSLQGKNTSGHLLRLLPSQPNHRLLNGIHSNKRKAAETAQSTHFHSLASCSPFGSHTGPCRSGSSRCHCSLGGTLSLEKNSEYSG